MKQGDVYMLNAPYNGGTHLPDITVIMPVFLEADETPAFFVAARLANPSDDKTPCRSLIYDLAQQLFVRARNREQIAALVLAEEDRNRIGRHGQADRRSNS